MRALLLVLLAVPAYGEERTWTISTGFYTTAAELVEVRGDIAYLKTADRVEHIPLARLSPADLQYIASQSRTPILPGPADETTPPEALPAPSNEFNAMPPGGTATADVAPPQLVEAKKPVTDSVGQHIPAGETNRYKQSEEILPSPTTSGSSTSRTVKIDPRASNNPYPPGLGRQQKPQQRQNTSNRDRTRDDDRRGLFGLRSRRYANGR